jgi:hypothetical protein
VAGLVSAWWLFPLGMIFWLIMVLAVARTPSLRISHQMQRRAPLAQRFQNYFDRVERVQVSVFNTLSSAPPRTRHALQPIQSEIDILVNEVHRLCQRMTALENYRLVSQSRSDLEVDLERIRTSLEATSDPVVQREYKESRRSLEERLVKLETVSNQLDRVEAQLMSVVSEMDGLVAEIIRLQALGAKDAANHVPALVRKVREMVTELKQFAQQAISV